MPTAPCLGAITQRGVLGTWFLAGSRLWWGQQLHIQTLPGPGKPPWVFLENKDIRNPVCTLAAHQDQAHGSRCWSRGMRKTMFLVPRGCEMSPWASYLLFAISTAGRASQSRAAQEQR